MLHARCPGPAVRAGFLTNVYGLRTAVPLDAVTVILLDLIGRVRAVRQPSTG
ncbi:hypothetical protein [Streptomyces violascens]|uniref:hypothetical protein n=1 Tax=Streptomyces violascens TaxID=67381 RepID=UPI001675C1E5|nr:hypothetical protein [Streptomyces violascens]